MKKVKDLELLTKYCEPVADDEEELLNCPFVYEYDGSPQSSPSVAAAVSPSESTEILMLSVPSTDSDGQSSAHENEEFETPPEQNNSSQPYFSGSDEMKPSTSGGVEFQQNNGDTEVTEAVDLGNDDDDDLGFSNDIGEFEEQLRKRYRISEGDLDVKKEPIVIEIDQTQTQRVDTEVVECEENVEVCERGIERNADHLTEKMSERDGGEMRENGERDVDDKEKLNGVGVCAKEMHSNEIKRSVGDGDGDGERGAVSMNIDENEKLNGVGAKEMHSNGITRSVGDGDGERGVVSTNLDENEKLKDGVRAKEIHSNGITRSVDVDGGGEGVSGVKGRRELPLSIRGGGKNVGSVEEVGRRATKNGTFSDLMEAFSVVVGDVSGDDKNAADFLETAKRRGLSFPRPRWWPPEGFVD